LDLLFYPAGGEIKRHVHVPLERHLVGTSEVIIVRRGCCNIDIYNDERELVSTRELRPGDIMLMVGGGHGFRVHEDTVLLEVKQGPYIGIDEKGVFLGMAPVGRAGRVRASRVGGNASDPKPTHHFFYRIYHEKSIGNMDSYCFGACW